MGFASKTVSHATLGLVLAAAIAGACGGAGNAPRSSPSVDAGETAAANDGGTTSFTSDSGLVLGTSKVVSIEVDPPSASIQSLNGAVATQAFTVTAHFADGSSAPATSGGISWSAGVPSVGGISASGVYSANGALGGVVPIAVTYGGLSASASLTVKLLLQKNPGSVPSGIQTGLQGATTADPSVVWAYPYDGTVWARGLRPPTLQWNGGATTDAYYVHIVSPTFELQEFTTSTGAPSSQLLLDATSWEQFTDSTSGASQVTVARWNGTADTVIASHTWTIAPASIRSTIYYWSNNLGRVLRIQPGAAAPDDFANQPPLSDRAQFQQDSCLMTCHTVSADGSTLVSGGGTFGGSFNLLTGQPIHSLGGTWGVSPNTAGQLEWQSIQWQAPALSPNGKYILTNSMGQGLMTASDTSAPTTDMGLFTTADGLVVSTSGVTGSAFAEPAWSPEGSRVAYVDSGNPSAWYSTWNAPPAGDLKVMEFNAAASPMFSAPQTMVTVGTGKEITWPTISPDGQWIVYGRAAAADTRSGNGDLYMASAVSPNLEVRLAKLDGDGYPFAAGARDLSWNYEPSFAPVAAGGYFWVVFTSRRSYGNTLTGQAEPCTGACATDANCATDACATTCACSAATEVKQLWVVAIDQNPKPGVDPSHAAFHLQGQDETNLAMRGFMSLPPCAQNGQSCASGTDCCGGFCTASADGGASVCTSVPPACAADGDKCTTSTDCCGAASGTTCINSVCSEPPPK